MSRMATHAAVALALGLLAAAPAAAQTSNGFRLDDALIPSNQILPGGPPKDGIPALDAPKFVAASETRLEGTDRLLGLSRRGISKAYPVSILNWHEIVNDRFGDEPVAVTYCPLCGTGMAYLARVRGGATTFGVSGLLYNSDVLLYDRSTESLWSQILAQAVAGPLKGHKLAQIPLEHTTWADWKRRHPDTLVLSTDTGFARDYTRDPYHDYAATPRLMFPVGATSDRLPAKEIVLGIEVDGARKAYPFSELDKALGERGQRLEDRLGGRKISIRFDREHRTAQAFDGSGREIPTVVGYWFAWFAFFPQTEVFTAR